MNYLRKNIFKNKAKLVFFGIAIFSFIVVCFIFLKKQINSIFELVILFLFTYLFTYSFVRLFINKISKILDPWVDKILKKYSDFKKGYDGEKEVGEWLKEILSENEYRIFRGLRPNQFYGDIDVLVVGPKGLIVIEVKKYSGSYHFKDNKFYSTKYKDIKDPRTQVRNGAENIRQFLKSHQIEVFEINGTVVFVDNPNIDFDGKTGIWISKDKQGLAGFIESIHLNPMYTPEFCNKINSLLENIK